MLLGRLFLWGRLAAKQAESRSLAPLGMTGSWFSADFRFLVFRRLRRIAIGSAVDIEPKKNGHNLCRLCPQERETFRKLLRNGRCLRHLQLGFGKRADDIYFDRLLGCVANGGKFADQKILCAFEHLLFTERKRLGAAEGDEAFQNCGHFHQRTGPHAIRIFLEAMLPVMVRSRAALLEKSKDGCCLSVTDDRAQANAIDVGLRNHYFQTARSDFQHVIPLRSAVQVAVTYLFDDPYAMVRIYDFFA